MGTYHASICVGVKEPFLAAEERENSPLKKNQASPVGNKKPSRLFSLSSATKTSQLKGKDLGLALLCRFLPDSVCPQNTHTRPSHKRCEPFGRKPSGKEVFSMSLNR